MSTLATQSYNRIMSKLNSKDQGLFNEAWKHHAMIDNETRWHTAWESKKLGITLSLLTADEDGHSILKRDKSSVSYFNDKAYSDTAIKQDKKIFTYKDELFTSLLETIPGEDHYRKATFLAIMFFGSILNSYMLPGEYTSKYGWRYCDELGLLRLTDIEGSDCVNRTIIMGDNVSWSMSNDCRDDVYLPGICYY